MKAKLFAACFVLIAIFATALFWLAFNQILPLGHPTIPTNQLDTFRDFQTKSPFIFGPLIALAVSLFVIKEALPRNRERGFQ